MSNHNLIDFAQKYYPNAPIHQSFPKIRLMVPEEREEKIDENNRNYNININITNVKNQCPRCSKFFSSKQCFESHFKSQINCHMKDLEMICPYCQKKFSRKFYSKKHIKKHKESQTQKHIQSSTEKHTESPPINKNQQFFPIELKLKTDHNALEKRLVELVEKQIVELIGKQNDEQNNRIVEMIENKTLTKTRRLQNL